MLPNNKREHATSHRRYILLILLPNPCFGSTRLAGPGQHIQEGEVRHARVHRRFVRSKAGQNTQSTIEAELMAISHGAKQAVDRSSFMVELSFTFTSIQCQSASTALEHCTSLGTCRASHGRNRIALRFFSERGTNRATIGVLYLSYGQP